MSTARVGGRKQRLASPSHAGARAGACAGEARVRLVFVAVLAAALLLTHEREACWTAVLRLALGRTAGQGGGLAPEERDQQKKQTDANTAESGSKRGPDACCIARCLRVTILVILPVISSTAIVGSLDAGHNDRTHTVANERKTNKK